MTKYTYLYSHKNDGRASAYSPEQAALNEAFVSFHEAGGYKWSSIQIENLACDQKDDHYPDICYHFRVIITNEPELSS